MASSLGMEALAAASHAHAASSSKDLGSDSAGSISGSDSPPPRGLSTSAGASGASSGAASAASSAAGGGNGGGNDSQAEEKRRKKLELNRIASRVCLCVSVGSVVWSVGVMRRALVSGPMLNPTNVRRNHRRAASARSGGWRSCSARCCT